MIEPSTSLRAGGGLQQRTLAWRDPAVVVQALADQLGQDGLVWLDGDGTALGRRSLLGLAPLEVVSCRGLPGEPGARDPFAALAAMVAGGGHWMGWLSYEAGGWVETGEPWRSPAMAQLWAARHDPVLEFDAAAGCLRLEGHDGARLAAMAAAIEALAPTDPDSSAAQAPSAAPTKRAAAAEPEPLEPGLPLENWHWHTDGPAFAAGVERIHDWIAAGDLFQANLTACCEQELTGHVDPLALYQRLRRRCPAPFGGLAIAAAAKGSNPAQTPLEAILSASPERFLQVSASGLVESRPIKGTRPRHHDPAIDADAAADLVSSAKDRAENVMIVDLLRNDLGRVCVPGSIQVPQLVGLESYAQVHHLTSVVQGQLRAGLGVVDLLRACWPGGSITGAPKVRACRRLHGLEPVPRGPYCGSLFRLAHDGSFDSSILIRSLFLQGRTLRAHAGCGIVADSDPHDEAEELGWKLGPLLEALA
ncbi:anthranilate synthase component I family protein [Synechococcus sp. CS-1328]|uniref:anthranilate synthase component I family protein n=1 Tax=Synechococcus sp. CS-1328 TaxID=2847976 RepID=UPI00223B27B9|nr:anthranilate synthase component I family protein [Synechococcus sp. CS-1328]